ncbi:MAG TPA: decarboxylating 6-phosphogluconate dehydrogenase [Anaerolineales bacterium]|nr:decarboxylating 6-phosphogluconate dehydrogenase [Anaerolineales bacterium]
MDLAMIGLGKMGGNMARRLSRNGHRVVGYAKTIETAARLAKEEEHFEAAESLEHLVGMLKPPRTAWLMLPAGDVTEQTLVRMLELFSPGDTLIEGGNSNYQDTIRRAGMASEAEIRFIDVGTSGGVWGLREGYSLMIGGENAAVEDHRPIFQTLAPSPDRGWGRVGPSGAGHFVKMVHNGIEYGMMQAFAEGFEIMKSKEAFDLDIYRISEIWRYGSVVRSWLLDLAAAGLREDPDLSQLKGWVADSGEGRWTVFEAINADVPAPVITLALQMRFISRQEESYAAKVLAMLRNQFGGHAVREAET